MNIQCICGIEGHTFASTVTDHSEDAIALFCDDAAYLLYLSPGIGEKYKIGVCPCSRELLTEYTRQYPLTQRAKTSCMYEQDDLTAIRIDYTEGHLYMMATEYYEIEIQLSDTLYDPLERSALPRMKGKHMKFLKRKDGD